MRRFDLIPNENNGDMELVPDPCGKYVLIEEVSSLLHTAIKILEFYASPATYLPDFFTAKKTPAEKDRGKMARAALRSLNKH